MKRFVLRVFVGLFCGTLLSMAQASTPSPSELEAIEVANLFVRWNDALATGDAGVVAAQYAPDAMLLPTVSGEARTTDAARQDYFRHFLARKPTGSIDPVPPRQIRVSGDLAWDAGHYTFVFADGSKVNARYTFIYERDGTDWRIKTHHSSMLP